LTQKYSWQDIHNITAVLFTCLFMIHQGAAPINDIASYQNTSVSRYNICKRCSLIYLSSNSNHPDT